MAKRLSEEDAKEFLLFQHRNRLLTIIREHSLCDPEEQNPSFIFQQCCNILETAFGCRFVWAGEDSFDLYLDIESSDLRDASDHHCVIWPVSYRHHTYGFVAMHCSSAIHFSELDREFIAHVIDDVALALFSQETALKLKIERDFNKEIVDTIQALMVTISPCGTIVSFNKRAEDLTGFMEHEVLEKYWVDVLINPLKRKEFQQFFSKILKGNNTDINFNAPLPHRDGTERHISWHGSIRHDIEKSKVGLVMLGIDMTDNLAADQQINKLTARWEKIFIAIQDPALVVSNNNVILEANPATCAAARKHRKNVIGKGVCDILHGGCHDNKHQCPLEQFIGYQKTRISETELHGLHGTYMLTVSPLLEENGEINATLLVARNLTEEEVVRAEAIRAAQLAAIGELASGVAHEINNPINGIINYAQIILDAPEDPEAGSNLENIINEGKRIARIVSNLLDFARQRKEVVAPVPVERIIANSLQLVAHLLKKDGISCSINIADSLPPLLCNEQQLQQVVLNLISNARYALNKRHPRPCAEKRIEINGQYLDTDEVPFLRLSFTDYGIGIPPEIQTRLFDPFFSTKPPGEGTGLGLSISHGLIRDHGGKIRVQSTPGYRTRFTIDLPVKPC
jgi:PAS domain S-box-containing protein